MATPRLIATATQVVCCMPSVGSSQYPAATAPATAPAVLRP